MYINLGNITVNRQSTINDPIIFVEVVDSKMSFENPVFVRTPEELDKWFGKTFKSRDYFLYLLERGISLYLYKPINVKSTYETYIDIHSLEPYEEEVVYRAKAFLPSTDIKLDCKYKVGYTNPVYYVYVTGTGWVLYSQIGQYVDRPGEYKNIYQLKIFANPSCLPGTGDSTKKYWVSSVGRWYLWIEDAWVDEEDLPQNTSNISSSLNNRDTLAITSTEIENLPGYFYPEYDQESRSLGLFRNEDYLDSYGTIVVRSGIAYYNTGTKVDIDIDSIESGEKTYSIREKLLDLSGGIGKGYVRIEKIDNSLVTQYGLGPLAYSQYKVISKYNEKVGHYTQDLCDEVTGETIIPGNLYCIPNKVNTLEDIANIYSQYRYIVEEKKTNEDYLFLSNKLVPVKDFYNFPSLSIQPSFRTNNNILTRWFMDYVDVEMWSRTIGTDADIYDEDKYIKVQIEETDYLTYRFTITRYDYSEIFEGSLYPVPGEEVRIDEIINQNSTLVYCKIRNGISSIRTGEFTLKGAEVEDYSTEMFWESLDKIRANEIYPDFILVPNISNYVSSLSSDYSYFKEYLDFLDIAKEMNCQVLVQNSDSPYKLVEVEELPEETDPGILYKVGSHYYIGEEEVDVNTKEGNYIVSLATVGNEYKFNYTEDKENRLIYFFRGLEYNYSEMPGYFVFIEGLLNNIMSYTTQIIVYDSPVSYPYDLPCSIVHVEELPELMKPKTIYIVDLGEGTSKYYLDGEEIIDKKLIQAVEDETVKSTLSNYKSNYLLWNNNIYYYKEYEDGENYESTSLMRFAIGRVYRELQKGKWNYLATASIGTIRTSITSILGGIVRMFSIIDSITIKKFNPQFEKNYLELTIDVSISDLVKNNITLDIVINYNKKD